MVGAHFFLAKVPQHSGAGAHLDIRMLSHQGKSGCAAGNQKGNWQAFGAQLITHGPDRRKGTHDLLLKGARVGLVQMPVISVQPARCHRWGLAQLPVQGQGRLAGDDAGAVHAYVEVNIKHQSNAGRTGRRAQGLQVGRVVHQGGEMGRGKSLDQGHQARNIGAVGLMGQQNVFAPCAGGHLGLGNGGDLELVDASGALHGNDGRELVGFDMGAQAADTAGKLDHALEVVLNALGVEQHGGRSNAVRVGDGVPGCHARGLSMDGSGFAVTRRTSRHQQSDFAR